MKTLFKYIYLVIILISPALANADTLRKVQLYVVRTADSDGSNAAALDLASMEIMVAAANRTYLAAGVEFQFNVATGIHPQVVNNTLLNRDGVFAAGYDLTDPKVEPKFDATKYDLARNTFARKFIGKIVVFVSRGDSASFNTTTKKWESVPRNGGFSNWLDLFVALPSIPANNEEFFLAHELGHYLHIGHTFSYYTSTKQEMIDLVRNMVNSGEWDKNNLLPNFDGDAPLITDTPADPGNAFWASIWGNDCGDPTHDSYALKVDFSPGVSRTINFKPDRDNVMSYFKHCSGEKHISPQQAAYVKGALDYGNRNILLMDKPPADGWHAPKLVATEYGNSKFAIFAVGADSAIRLKFWDPTVGKYTPDSQVWTWLSGLTIGMPTVTSWGADRYDLFVRGVDNNIYHKAWAKNSFYPSITGWESIGGGGEVSSDPVAFSRGEGRLDVFHIGKNHTLLWKQWTGSNWQPADATWNLAGLGAYGKPSIVSWSGNRFDIFARLSDNTVGHRAFVNGTWYPNNTGWERQGGNPNTDPIAVSSDENKIDLFIINEVGELAHKAWNGQQWLEWEYISKAEFQDIPAAVVMSKQHLFVFARATGGKIKLRELTGKTWGEWMDADGNCWEAPTVIKRNAQVFDLMCRSFDGTVNIRSNVSGRWAGPWSSLGKYIE